MSEWTTTTTKPIAYIPCGSVMVRADRIESFEARTTQTDTGKPLKIVTVAMPSGATHIFRGTLGEFMKLLRSAFEGVSE